MNECDKNDKQALKQTYRIRERCCYPAREVTFLFGNGTDACVNSYIFVSGPGKVILLESSNYKAYYFIFAYLVDVSEDSNKPCSFTVENDP